MLLPSFKSNWNNHFSSLHPNNATIIVAVSGGVDSVVLLHLLHQMGFECVVAHCNFQLRGNESQRDEAFVQQLAQSLNMPFWVTHFDTEVFAQQHKMAIQEAARQLRYDWFETLRLQLQHQQSKNVYIATAHHADDNIETVVMQFFRGTGINGLRGILPFLPQQHLVRPLLFAKKEQVVQYATEHQIAFVNDSSNESNKYTRNYIRNQLLPAMAQVYPAVQDNILANIRRMNDVFKIYSDTINNIKVQLIEKKASHWQIPVLKLQKQVAIDTVLWEIFSAFDFTAKQIPDIKNLIIAGNGSYVASHTHRVIKNRKWLIIAPLAQNEQPLIVIEAADEAVVFPLGNLVFSKHEAPITINTNLQVAQLNAAQISYPLILRKWKTGDYFYPLGMNKKKKISRFLIDLKLSIQEKESVWVLESNKRIVWVIGKRIDHRFRIEDHTQQVLQIQLAPIH